MSTITKLGKVSILARGNYESTTKYEKLDLVTKDGASYLCRKTCTGIAPTLGVVTEYWQPFGTATQIASTTDTGIVRLDGSTLEVKDSTTGKIGIESDLLGDINDTIAEVQYSGKKGYFSKNLIRLEDDAYQKNGVYVTITDGIVNLNGMATQDTTIDIASFSISYGSPDTHKMVGCPTGGSGTTYYQQIDVVGADNIDYGNGVEFIPTPFTEYTISIVVKAGTTMSHTFKPMIVDSNYFENASYDDFEPYAISGSEAVDNIMEVIGTADEMADLPSPTDSICANITAINDAIGDLIKIKTYSSDVDITTSNQNVDVTFDNLIGYTIASATLNCTVSNLKTLYIRTLTNAKANVVYAGNSTASNQKVTVRAVFVKS